MDAGERTTRTTGGTARAADAERRLEHLLDVLAASRSVPHAVLAVEATDGSFRWAGARGDARPGGPPMRIDTPYYVASIDKMFTTVAVLQLVERGRLRLDEPIAAYLPDALTSGLHRLDGRDRSGQITVRHLLSHTSGLASYLEDAPKGGRSLVRTLSEEGDRAWDVHEMVRLVRDELTPHFPPQPPEDGRSRVRYCDTNFALLHAILEAVTGRPVHEVFRERLFEPLGLRRTWMPGRTEPPADGAEPAALHLGDRPLEIPLALRSLGAILSTADDQLRFMKALARAEPFEDPASLERMLGPWHRFGVPRDAATLRAPSWPIEYGLGIKRFRLPRLLTGFRPMPTLLGHSGSTGTWLFHAPELGVVIAGVVDQVTAGAVPYRFLPRVARALADARPATPSL